jgi:hypothetical protein
VAEIKGPKRKGRAAGRALSSTHRAALIR